MILHLDPAMEQRIQREIELGHFANPSEVIAHALSLLDEEADWLQHHRESIDERLRISLAQAKRGELYTTEEAHRILIKSR